MMAGIERGGPGGRYSSLNGEAFEGRHEAAPIIYGRDMPRRASRTMTIASTSATPDISEVKPNART